MRGAKFVKVNGIDTRYFAKGRGEPLVLIHGGQYGMYYDSSSWSRNFEGLARSFRVYAFDRLGMGYTDNPRSDKEYTIGATVRHACDFLDVLGIMKASLAGHSRGAYVAAQVAIERPDLARNLIVVDSNTLAPDDPSTPRDFYFALDRKRPKVETMATVHAEVVANSYSRSHITPDFVRAMYKVARLPRNAAARLKFKTLGPTLFLPDIHRQRRATLRQIGAGKLRVPTLIVWGRNDPSAPLKLALRLFDIIGAHATRTQLHVFNRAGHYCFRDYPEDFNHVVKTFIGLSQK
jgi:2-hydroxy-6-oxo-6-(2'-carboxyphenyl)-hexa-2,4-dienoate hydrolase